MRNLTLGAIWPAMLLLCITTFFPAAALADGCVFASQGPAELALTKVPAIPAQRALLRYRDGQEKLIIETAFKAEGDRFGWIIPLPATPTQFEATTPGLLKTVALATRPIIKHETGSNHGLIGFCVLIGFFAVVAFLANGYSLGWAFLPLIMIFLAAISISTPPPGNQVNLALGKGGERVWVESSATVGSYKVETLKAESAEALNGWLASNGYAKLSDKGLAITRDLIKENWRFVAAQLQRDSKGQISRPHPIALTFPTPKMIYPMRLTAYAETPVYLELFVVSDKQAAFEPLELEYCDNYDVSASPTLAEYKESLREPVSFVSKTHQSRMEHPDARKIFWPGCVLTRLSGTIRPDQMKSDIVLESMSAKPFRLEFYSKAGASEVASGGALVLWFAGIQVCLIVLCSKVRYEKKGWLFTARVKDQPNLRGGFMLACGCVTGVCYLIYLTIYLCIPSREVTTKTVNARVSWTRIANIDYYLQKKIESFTYKTPELANQDIKMIRQSVAEFLAENSKAPWAQNWFAGEPIIHEDSPGNYTIFEDQRGVVFRTYTGEGTPKDLIIRSAGKSSTGASDPIAPTKLSPKGSTGRSTGTL